MSDALWDFPISFSGSTLKNSVHFVFRLFWIIESMWVILVPAACVAGGMTVYRQTKSPVYSILASGGCFIAWLISRHYALGHVSTFISPQFKECVSTVRILLHNIKHQLHGKYNYSYPLIINLGILRKYQLGVEFHPASKCKVDRDMFSRLNRYMNFAAASYGVLFYPNHARSSIRRLCKRYRTASITTTVSENVISEMTGVPDRDIIMVQLKGENPLRPGYYICVDDNTSAVILVIRGTLTLSDALTDISCVSRPFVGGVAHHGISVSAVSIFEEVKVILENLIRRTGYGLVVCGHSLGAGTAVLLSIYLLENQSIQSHYLSKCPVRCYAYAPPPVYAADTTPERWSDNIITVVNGSDIIPRVSLANMHNLLLQMQYIDQLKLTFWERCKLILDNKSDTLLEILEGLDNVGQTGCEGFKALRHIGKIVWIDTKQPDTSTDTNPKPVLLQPSLKEWDQIYIGNNFISDHWPHNYQKTLQLFTNECGYCDHVHDELIG